MYPESAWEKWGVVSKILLMAVVAIPLIHDRARFRLLLIVTALSVGFYGFKGGLFVLMNGGQYMVLGPPASFFESNNELGLVLNMSLPLLLVLAKEEEHVWRRRLLWATFFLTMLAVPFTYSRGAVLGLAAVLAMLFLRARRRVIVVALAIGAVVAFSLFVPSRWTERMETLEAVRSDESAQLRLMSWQVAYDIAVDRPVFGGGFKVFTHRTTYDIYLPEYPRAFGHDAHSIYFNLLGEHGWIGLGLFLGLVGCIFGTLRKLRRTGQSHPQLGWVASYSHMLQASLVAYLVTGAFLSAAYFDLAYQLFVAVVILKRLADEEQAVVGDEAVAVRAPVPAVPIPRARRVR
jgi:probable O-glycosylation ligase (exosortase A-associated)